LKEFTLQHRTKIDPSYYSYIVNGMRMAVTGGTCRRANLPGLDVCGKTGTVQNPHGQDHSVFMGFAPKDDPKIAICVYAENAGFGAQVAVPMGAMIIERYLRGSSEEIESRASKWSGHWMEETPAVVEQEEVSPAPSATPAPTASNSPYSGRHGDSPLDREQEKAILTTTTRATTTRNGIYKG
ncbi:MAG: hypothetical protein IIU17_06325, partial [Muribaculaceae bacterium]|nr:hypothetical protein [Muribaculaceae bacterium]